MTEETIHTRGFSVREVGEGTRTFSGIAVPYGVPAHIRDWLGEYTETFERGSVTVPESGKVMLYWRHDEPIGLITAHEDREDGWHITARISQTARGDEAYALLRDGVVDELSIGFQGVRHKTDATSGNITRTEVLAREVSLVPLGAYGSNAKVAQVREAAASPTHTEREAMSATEVTTADLEEIRTGQEDLKRSFTALLNRETDEPKVDRRSAGALLKAIVAGDQTAIDSYNRAQEHMHDELQQRAYTGGTTDDAPVKDAWVGDLTRIYDASSGAQSRFFETGTLPAEGNFIEFAELATNTVAVDKQDAEGDDLTYGKVTLTTRTAPVETFGGYTELTKQAIQRSSLPLLNRSLEALSVAAGARKKASLRAAVAAVVTARKAVAANAGVVVLGATLSAGTAGNWEDALVDAALKYDALNLEMERLFVSATVFKKLRSLTVSGERVFTVSEGNRSGTLDLPGLRGDFAGIPVSLDAGQAGDEAYFANSAAIRQYNSALYSLSDENIINLSETFSVYFYGAIAAEIPSAIIPVKLAAS